MPCSRPIVFVLSVGVGGRRRSVTRGERKSQRTFSTLRSLAQHRTSVLNVCFGSVAPLRFLNQRSFDWFLMPTGVPIL
jgi:hypothetical protein